jgi:thiol-disulfide isomerase/thioredoxin
MTEQNEPQPPAEGSETSKAKTRSIRPVIQIAAAALGLYLIGSGLYGLMTGGNKQGEGNIGQTAQAPGSCKADPAKMQAIKAASLGEVAGFSTHAEPMPFGNFSFQAPDGSKRQFSDFSGKVMLVNLWATWCAPCRKEMPALDELQRIRGGTQFEVLAVNVDTRNPEKASEFLDEIGVKSLVRYADAKGGILQDMKKANRAPGLPSTVLLDRQGCELGFILGPAEWASKDALALIDAALNNGK